MKLHALFGACATAVLLTACGGGDINVNAENRSTDNSVNNSNNTTTTDGGSTGGDNPCAQYVQSGVTFQGSFANGNCTYGSDFVDLTKPFTGDEISFVDLENDGVHIFRGSLVVGENFSEDADLASAGITQGGDGSTIRIAAGATLAFTSNDDYFVINRGSQIFANGELNAPVTITSVSDAVDGTVGAEDVQEWGGMIINGFGVTNKCAYTGTLAGGDIATTDCHVEAEGKSGAGQTHYGGANNADNSGELEYFIVKHTGAEVSEGNELNGIAFNAIGSGTTVNYLQAYATFDDGIEFFGGAVDINNYVAMYVRDDSIDIDEGYRGTITNALVIQSETDGNRCVESDGIGSYSGTDAAVVDQFIAADLHSQATIQNLTCIVSAQEVGTHDPGQGLRIREAHSPTIVNALVTTAYSGDELVGDDDHNFCVRIDSGDGSKTNSADLALNGELTISSSIFACQDLIDDDLNGASTLTWLTDTQGNDAMQTAEAGEDPTSAADANVVILDGYYSLPIGDVVINGGAATVTPANGQGFIGAVSADDDWTAGWAYGLDPANRGQDLWFE